MKNLIIAVLLSLLILLSIFVVVYIMAFLGKHYPVIFSIIIIGSLFIALVYGIYHEINR